MGTKFCSECSGYQQQVIITKQALYDKDQPTPSYARCQPVHFDVHCATNHIFTQKQNSEITIDPQIQRGRLDKRSYLILGYNVYYTGQWKEGFPHGLGEIVFQNGSILKSTFVNGKAKGTDSILAMDDGSFYRGNIDNNSLCGKGVFKEKNGHIYEGEWSNNVPHGKGIEKFENGDIYEGEYENGIKKGLGRYKWKNDLQFIEYSGQFDNDYMKGQGTLITKDCKIMGVFHESNIEDARFSQGSLDFRGSIVNGSLSGYGKIVNSFQKIVYEGSFENGQPHGKGTLTLQNGEVKKGFWVQGRYVKQHLGISIQNLGKCLDMIQEELEERQYEQDVVQELKRRLKEGGFENLSIQITVEGELKRKSKKYLIVEIGQKWLQIFEE